MASIGDRLAGRYRLDARIGRGAFASVFRARDRRLQRDVAVKVLHANLATDPVIAARFDREARVLATVSHPNVVAIHDVAPADPTTGAEPFLVMDLCDGGSLADRLAASETGALPPDHLIAVVVDVAAGLDALHGRGIVHRDLKPSNVLLSEDRARIADLGIAAAGPSELTSIGTTVGTLAYLAPEQLAGEPGSPASDVHALGVMAFLGLTGRLPRPAGSVNELVAASARRVVPVSSVRPDLGSAFDAVVGRALARDPRQRPTAAQLGASLAAAMDGWWARPLTVASPDGTTRIDVPVPRAGAAGYGASRHGPDGRVIVAATTLVAVLIVGSAAFLVLGRGGPGGSAALLGGGAGLRTSPSASASEAPTPAPTPTPTPPPTPTPTLTPTATPTTTPTVDPYADARAAGDEMSAAIEAARGGHGLKGHDAKDLQDHLDRFDQALDQHRAKTAGDEATKLADRIAELIDQEAVDGQAADRLSTAADELLSAAGALQD